MVNASSLAGVKVRRGLDVVELNLALVILSFGFPLAKVNVIRWRSGGLEKQVVTTL